MMTPDCEVKSRGFTLIEIMIVVLLIAILLSIAVPGFFHSRDIARSRVCVQNMREIEAAKTQYLIEMHLSNTHDFNADPTGGITELYPKYTRTYPACPSGGNYSLNSGNSDATCSFALTDPTHTL